MRLNTTILRIYTYSTPFTSAFAPSPTITIPVLLLPLVAMSIIKPCWSQLRKENFGDYVNSFFLKLAMLMICGVVASFLFNGFGSEKSLNHTIAYLTSILGFFVLVHFALQYAYRGAQMTPDVFCKWCYEITLVCAVFILLEFIISNAFSPEIINSLIPRPAVTAYEPTAFGIVLRSRGFAEESGHIAFFLETLFPFGLSWISKRSRPLAITYCVLGMFAILATMSTASFVIIPLSCAIGLAMVPDVARRAFKPKNVLAFFAVVMMAYFFTALLSSVFSTEISFLSSIDEKLNSYSADDRKQRVDFFVKTLLTGDPLNWVIGFGPAAHNLLGMDDSYSVLNLYYKIFLELGIISILFWASLFGGALWLSARINKNIYQTISLSSAFLHYLFIANYWFPNFWLVLAATLVFRNKAGISSDG